MRTKWLSYTYKELLEHLQSLTEYELDQEIMFIDDNNKTFSIVTDIYYTKRDFPFVDGCNDFNSHMHPVLVSKDD